MALVWVVDGGGSFGGRHAGLTPRGDWIRLLVRLSTGCSRGTLTRVSIGRSPAEPAKRTVAAEGGVQVRRRCPL
jgi:hypothetical protein